MSTREEQLKEFYDLVEEYHVTEALLDRYRERRDANNSAGELRCSEYGKELQDTILKEAWNQEQLLDHILEENERLGIWKKSEDWERFWGL